MKTCRSFLETLNEYPSGYQIDEASNYAQDKAAEYLAILDDSAVLTVDDGECYVRSEKEIDFEFLANVQSIFDEAFGERIYSLGFRE